MNEWTDYTKAHQTKGRWFDPTGDPTTDLFMPLIVILCVLGVVFWLGYTAILWVVKAVL